MGAPRAKGEHKLLVAPPDGGCRICEKGDHLWIIGESGALRAKGNKGPHIEELVWGIYIKKRGTYIFSTSCSSWPGLPKVGGNPQRRDVDSDGACPHYTQATKKQWFELFRKY